MQAKNDWTVEQVKQLQTRLKVWPSGNLEHETWAALTKALGMVEPAPIPAPVPAGGNPYSVKNHILYKDSEPVSFKPSPNHGGTIKPELIVIHYTGTPGLSSPLDWLTQSGSGVSSHLIISTEGIIWQLLPFNIRAWHAGKSSWDGRGDCNSWSIGIENVGTGAAWPEKQIEANRQVVEVLAKAYGITEVVGHEDVAPGRKVDPGSKYPWDKVWPEHV